MCHATKRPKHVNKFLPTQAQSLSELRAQLNFPTGSDAAVEAIYQAQVSATGKHASHKAANNSVSKNYIGWTTIMKERSAA